MSARASSMRGLANPGAAALTTARRVFAVVFSIFMLLPLTIILVASFTNEGYVQFPPESFGIRWYVAAIENRAFMDGLIFSLETAIGVAVVAGLLGIAGALVLARTRFPGRDAILSLLLMPLALPHIVLAIALLQIFGSFRIATSPWGLMAGHVLITLPYVLRLTMTSLLGFDRQIERASASLGASSWQTFRYVTLPMIAPGVVAGLVFAFLLSFDEVTISLFTSLPGRTTLPAEIFNFATQGSDPVVTAVSGLMIIIASGVLLIVERFFGVLRLIANEQR
jgi:putative spermidine/putrescine transport system permease protein